MDTLQYNSDSKLNNMSIADWCYLHYNYNSNANWIGWCDQAWNFVFTRLIELSSLRIFTIFAIFIKWHFLASSSSSCIFPKIKNFKIRNTSRLRLIWTRGHCAFFWWSRRYKRAPLKVYTLAYISLWVIKL